MQELRDYLLKEMRKLTTLERAMSLQEWSWLQKLIVVRIITFNARRGGESTKVLKSDWFRCDQWKRQEDIESLTDPVEKRMAIRLKVLCVKGKRKRRVPIIFTEDLQHAISVLHEQREKMDINLANPYLFPRPTRGSVNAIRGWDAVNEVAKKAQLKKPELITSTKIRKHLATVLQLLDMDEGEFTWVTNHLGHSADVHRKWYRQEDSTMELTKIAKLLIAKDRGESLQHKKMTELCGSSTQTKPIGTVKPKECNIPMESEEKQEKPKHQKACNVDFKVAGEGNEESEDRLKVESFVGQSKDDFTNGCEDKDVGKRRIAYSSEEISALRTYFAAQISAKRIPGTLLVEAAQKKYSVLQRRSISSIRSKVFTFIKEERG